MNMGYQKYKKQMTYYYALFEGSGALKGFKEIASL